jgi:DNA-binding transcriptional regulator YdaS (Cro superfamily)
MSSHWPREEVPAGEEDLRIASRPLAAAAISLLFWDSWRAALKRCKLAKVMLAPRRLAQAVGGPSKRGTAARTDQKASMMAAPRLGRSPSTVEQAVVAAMACCTRREAVVAAALGSSVSARSFADADTDVDRAVGARDECRVEMMRQAASKTVR